MKTCSKCGDVKEAKEFGKMRNQCDECRKAYSKAWREANPEKAKAYKKAWYEANPEKVKAYSKAWYEAITDKSKADSKAWREANPEKFKACKKAWYEANTEKVKARNKAWREANTEKVKARNKAWREANPEKVKAYKKAWREANHGQDHKRKLWTHVNDRRYSLIFEWFLQKNEEEQHDILKNIPEIQSSVLIKRLGLFGNQKISHSEVGKFFGFTRQNSSLLQKKAENKLRGLYWKEIQSNKATNADQIGET